jgi:hypothetical protein
METDENEHLSYGTGIHTYNRPAATAVERRGAKGGKSRARESRGLSGTKADRRKSKHQSHSRAQAVDGGSQSDGSSVTEDSDEERRSESASGSELMRPSLPDAAMLMSGSDGIGMNVVCAPQVTS